MKHLILGNGPAGVVAAEALRRAAPRDEIVMVGSENLPSYSRMAIPYLLEGNIDESGTYLRKAEGHFDSLCIRQRRGRAVAVNAEKDGIFPCDCPGGCLPKPWTSGHWVRQVHRAFRQRPLASCRLCRRWS